MVAIVTHEGPESAVSEAPALAPWFGPAWLTSRCVMQLPETIRLCALAWAVRLRSDDGGGQWLPLLDKHPRRCPKRRLDFRQTGQWATA